MSGADRNGQNGHAPAGWQRKFRDDDDRVRAEPIAVVGLGCRFPGGVVDGESYWDLLTEGTDAVSEVPSERWDVDEYYSDEPRRPGKVATRWGGFMDRIDRFDHDFFGISHREALAMDPHQRLMLEVAWEALENAGIAPSSLAGSRTGVFTGACNWDFVMSTVQHADDVSAYTSSGTALSFVPGRIAYLLDLRGPNISVDTACSSSLVAVHQACQALRLGEADLALAGGVNVVLSPLLLVSLSQYGSVAPGGRAKTFSDEAEGYVRGEGCGVIVLKRLSDALVDGDNVLAVLRGGAVNSDGRSSGITAPNGDAQRRLFTDALNAAGVEPDEVGYIEAHGTGTKLGDPIEVEALSEVYGRPEGAPVYLGSVKTNIGHLEAAAGIAGLIKVVLCLQHGAVPKNVHFERLNPAISLDGTTFEIPTELTKWDPSGGRRIATVSSFGLSGTNAHLILEEGPEPVETTSDDRRPASLLALSAKSETALLKLARRYANHLRDADDVSLADICYSANTGRAHFAHRIAIAGSSHKEIATQLRDVVRGDTEGIATGVAERSEIAFLFTGQGAQRPGMTRSLYETQPTFRSTVDRCAEILAPLLDRPLLELLFPAEGSPDADLINNTAYAQPATFAVEYALAQLWRSWGVKPGAVFGHSLGEYVAATVAGVMSLEDGLKFVVRRARLIADKALPGAMAAIAAPEAEVAEEIADHPDRISIAAVNGPANTTISGDAELVQQVRDLFDARGVRAKVLHIASSGHSPLMQPVIAPLREAAADITFHPPKIPLISNVTGALFPWDSAPDGDYWGKHTRRPVMFAAGVKTLHDLGYRDFLEVGPAPTLLGLISDSLPAGSGDLLVPSLRPKQDDWEVLLAAVARLYARGADIDWAAFDADYARSRVSVPTYAFDPTRVWQEPKRRGEGLAPVVVPAPASPVDDAVSGEDAAPAQTEEKFDADTVRALAGQERVKAITAWLTRIAGRVLGRRASSVNPDEQFTGLGLDSLMAVELRNEITSGLGVTVAIAEFLEGGTIRGVAARLAERLGEGGDGAVPAAPRAGIRRVARTGGAVADLLAQVDGLSEDEVRALVGGKEQG